MADENMDWKRRGHFPLRRTWGQSYSNLLALILCFQIADQNVLAGSISFQVLQCVEIDSVVAPLGALFIFWYTSTNTWFLLHHPAAKGRVQSQVSLKASFFSSFRFSSNCTCANLAIEESVLFKWINPTHPPPQHADAQN